MDELNSKNRIAIRRHHNQLKITSNGIMILGVWSIFKAFMLAISDNTTNTAASFKNTQGGIWALAIGFFIVLLIDFRLRLVIWRGARKEAYGRDTNNRYLVLTIFLIILSVLSIGTLFYALIKGTDDRRTTFASILVEVTSLAIMIELVSSGFKLRKIRSEIENENKEVD